MLTDVNAEKLKGEMMDLQHGLTFCRSIKISAGTGKNCGNGMCGNCNWDNNKA